MHCQTLSGTADLAFLFFSFLFFSFLFFSFHFFSFLFFSFLFFSFLSSFFSFIQQLTWLATKVVVLADSVASPLQSMTRAVTVRDTSKDVPIAEGKEQEKKKERRQKQGNKGRKRRSSSKEEEEE